MAGGCCVQIVFWICRSLSACLGVSPAAFNQSARFESTTVLVIVSHFTIHFRRHKPPNNFRLMRLNCVFIATIFALAVGLDSTSAATDTTAIKLSNVMNSADANDRRVLRAHKDANAETEEERGFADVVDEVMAKLKAEKIFAEVLKTKSLAATEKIDDMRVWGKLDEIVQPEQVWKPIFKNIDEELGISPKKMAKQLKTRHDMTIDQQNFLLYYYTRYWYRAHPDKMPHK